MIQHFQFIQNLWQNASPRTLFGAAAAVGLLAGLTAAPAPAAASLSSCKASIWKSASAKGVSRSTFDRAMANVRFDPEVLEKARRQPEFTKTMQEYLSSAVSDKRVENGKAMKQEWAQTLDALEQRFGVDRHILLAIWGMESSYGQVLENPEIVKPVIQSLTTLACEGGRRKRFGRQQLLASLQILQRGDVAPQHMTGSWAGAMGHTQFIPTTYNAYAVDFTGDGKRDIWFAVSDALASTANYLRKSGWQPGKTWGYEITLPRTFNYELANRKSKKTIAEWKQLGVTRVGGQAFPRPDDKARLLLPSGANGPGFLMLRNFDAILRYNNADAYALGVGHLSDRIRGGGTFVNGWPENDRPLNFAQRKQLQSALTRRGFSTGGVDGKIGPKTRGALRAYQRSAGLIADGHPTLEILQGIAGGG